MAYSTTYRERTYFVIWNGDEWLSEWDKWIHKFSISGLDFKKFNSVWEAENYIRKNNISATYIEERFETDSSIKFHKVKQSKQ